MYNRTYFNDDGKKVSGAAANSHLLKKHIEEDTLIQFLDNEISDSFKTNYIKSPQDMEKLSEVIKMYCSVTLSSPGAMFDVKSPYITDKEFTMAALNDLKYTYLDGYDIYNEVIVEVW